MLHYKRSFIQEMEGDWHLHADEGCISMRPVHACSPLNKNIFHQAAALEFSELLQTIFFFFLLLI